MLALVADNSRTSLEFIRRVLEEQAFEVHTEADGLAALNAARRLQPEVIFLDVVMPQVPGDQLCRYLKRLPGLEKVPVILVSGVCAEEPERLGDCGADALVAKNRPEILKQSLCHLARLIKEGRLGEHDPRKLLGGEGLYPRHVISELMRERGEQWSLYQEMDLGMAILNHNLAVVYANPAFCRAFGREESSALVGLPLARAVPEALRPKLEEALRSGAESPATLEMEMAGRLLVLSCRPAGKAAQEGPLVLLQDITERRFTENLLQDSERRHRLVMEAISDAVLALDPDWRVTLANPAAHALSGLRPPELIGLDLEDAWPGARSGDMWPALLRVMQEGHAETLTTGFNAANKAARWFEVRLFPSAKGVLLVARDTTHERRHLELLKAERDLGLALSRAEALEQALRLCLKTAVRVTGLEGGAAHLVEESGGLRLVAQIGVPHHLMEHIRKMDALNRQTAEIMAGKPFYWENGALPFNDLLPEEQKVCSAAIMPILHEGRVLACLSLGSRSMAFVPEYARYALESLASRTGNAIARLQAEAAGKKLIAELQEALGEVRQLSGMLPICANCKKIRNDKGYWQSVEQYLSEHSQAQFSHGICPECKEKYYKDIF